MILRDLADRICMAVIGLARRMSNGTAQEWLDALAAEVEDIDGAAERLAWAMGAARVAWAMSARSRVDSLLRTWPAVVIVVMLGVLAMLFSPVPMLALLLAGVTLVGFVGAATVRAITTGSGLLLLKRPTFGVPAAGFAVLLAVGATQVVGAATQPDTQCTEAHATSFAAPSDPRSAADYLALGDYDYDRGACDAAVLDYTRAIELEPQYAAAYNDRAYTAMRQQNYAAALADLNQAIELRPDYVNALMNRGDIYNYYFDIDRRKAIADYDRVIALGATGNNSVCGHRMLAYYGGWTPRIYVDVLLHGTETGCTLGS